MNRLDFLNEKNNDSCCTPCLRGPIDPQGPAGEAGQLILTLNGDDLAYAVAGRATGTSQIIGMAIVITTAINSILTVRNPPEMQRH